MEAPTSRRGSRTCLTQPAWVMTICLAYLEPFSHNSTAVIAIKFLCNKLNFIVFFSHKKVSQSLETLARKWNTLE